jgi:hypothetical protein
MTPAKFPASLKQRMFTSYIIVFDGDGTPANGTPYCAGSSSTLGVKTVGFIFLHPMKKTNTKSERYKNFKWTNVKLFC